MPHTLAGKYAGKFCSGALVFFRQFPSVASEVVFPFTRITRTLSGQGISDILSQSLLCWDAQNV